PDLRHAATSLLSVSDSVSRFEVATAVVAALTALIQDSHSGSNSGEWHAELTRRDVLFGRRIDVLEPESGRPLASGTADGIAEDGALRIRHDGNVMSIRSGTIRLAGDHPA